MMRNNSSIVGLVKELKEAVKAFLRDEIQLLKAEMSEKLAAYGRSSVGIAGGAVLAFAGLIVFLCTLGAVIACGLLALGLAPLPSVLIGFGIISIIAAALGAATALASIRAAKKVPPAPERTVRTLQQLTGGPIAEGHGPAQREKKDHRTPEQVEASVVLAGEQITDTLEELAGRASVNQMRRRMAAKVREHPFRWGLILLGCGAAGGYAIKRKLAKTAT